MGVMAGCTLVTGALVVRKLLVAPESKMALLLIESMSMLTMRRRAAAATALLVFLKQILMYQIAKLQIPPSHPPNHITPLLQETYLRLQASPIRCSLDQASNQQFPSLHFS
jgi:hypothetical protein